jgi:pyruvate formate lyase activating enzyme
VTPDFPVVGFRKLSITDYTGKLCAVLTAPGCNFRCPYCPNEELIHHYIPMEKYHPEDIRETLYPRIGFLDGICITGGEPTLHRRLPEFLESIKETRSLVKIDTNGSRPIMLRILLDRRLVDYITLKIVARIEDYPSIAGPRIEPEVMLNTIQMIRKSRVPHEFKVTAVPTLNDEKTLLDLAHVLAGSRRFVIKQFNPETCLDPSFKEIQPYSLNELKQLKDRVAPYFAETVIEL